MSFQKEFEKRNNKPRAAVIAGYPCLVRRASLSAWITAGLVPQELVNELAKNAPTGDEDEPLDIGQSEAIALGQRLQQLKIELSVTTSEGSRFTFTGEPGKVNIFDLDDPDAFIREAITTIDGVPIPTATGEVSATALASFRQNGSRADELAGPGVHSEPVQEIPG